jgi:DinB superfamily
MDSGIARQFEQLESRKEAFLHTIFAWTPAQLRFRPLPDSWCALEVLDHVVKTETGIFAEMRSNFAVARTTALAHRCCAFLLNTLMSSPVRLKVPAEVAPLVLPDNAPHLRAMLASWSAARIRHKEWIGCIGDAHAELGLFRHPVSGWMTPSQTLRFLSAHLHHHGYQLRRIRGSPGWPKVDSLG